MYAMILDENRDFKWAELPDPVRKPGEVVIEVHAAAVNRADLMQKDGSYASPPDWPQWCGLEVAGVICEADANSAFKPGDRVCALVGGGGYSGKIAVPEGMVIPIPDEMSMIRAASIPEVWCTVYLNLQLEAGGLKPGEVFFVQAGASGVGLAAIQLAKLQGAEVIVTVGSPEKAAFVKNLGADLVVNHRTDDLREVLKAHPPAVAPAHGVWRTLDHDRHARRCGNFRRSGNGLAQAAPSDRQHAAQPHFGGKEPDHARPARRTAPAFRFRQTDFQYPCGVPDPGSGSRARHPAPGRKHRESGADIP